MKNVQGIRKNNKGFTLVELLIVVAIIAMLIAMIAPNLTAFLDTATDTTLRANAKTAYTSANAWITQQRVAGVGLETIAADNPLIIKLDESGEQLVMTTAAGTYTGMNTYKQLVNMFNAGEFGSSTQLHIWFTSGYVVTKVEWIDGTGSAAYPD